MILMLIYSWIKIAVTIYINYSYSNILKAVNNRSGLIALKFGTPNREGASAGIR